MRLLNLAINSGDKEHVLYTAKQNQWRMAKDADTLVVQQRGMAKICFSG